MLPSNRLFRCSASASLPGFLVGQSQSDSGDRQRLEEAENYYRKWLEKDVLYIITPDEKAVFQRLSTTEEKDNFIEQFWVRRDDDLSTVENPVKQEHYRRIAYANEHFASGYPGWLTDRGRIYITFGPPDETEYHSSGETYSRPLNEGGGITSTFPYQVWRYRHIEGVGTNIILEFVDRTLSGEFRLAVHPDEKDALWNTDAGGPTLLEQLEMAKKRDRGTLQQQLGFERERDSAFLRFETYTKVLSPPKIRYKDLQQVVDTDIRYADLPFVTRDDYIRLNENQVLALVSLQVNNKELNFEEEDGVRSARLAVYGIVTSIAKRVVYEFDDDLQIRFDAGSFDAALEQSAVYQKIIPLDQGRYKISLVVKDLNSDRIGVVERAIRAARLPGGHLDGQFAHPFRIHPHRSSVGRDVRPGRPQGSTQSEQGIFEPKPARDLFSDLQCRTRPGHWGGGPGGRISDFERRGSPL